MEAIPYLIAAVFCEGVLQEKDGTLSVIRIADKVEVGIEARGMDVPKDMVPAFQIRALIAVKSGDAKGMYNIRLVGEAPSGKKLPEHSFPVELKGGDHGQNLIVNITMAAKEEGVHWFGVFANEHRLTRIPLMILRAKPAAAPQTATQRQP